MSWICEPCAEDDCATPIPDYAPKCPRCGTLKPVKRDTLVERWKHSEAAMRVIRDTPVFDQPHSPLDIDPDCRIRWRDVAPYILAGAALVFAFCSGYVAGAIHWS